MMCVQPRSTSSDDCSAMELQAQSNGASRMYRLSEPLFEVLQVAGARRNTAYRWKEVLMLLVQYLMRRRPSLLDPTDNTRVLCAGDPIAAVFGVTQFTKNETKSLVRRHVIPVSAPGSSRHAPAPGAAACSAAACSAGSSGSVVPSEPTSSGVKRSADAEDDQDAKRSRTTESDGDGAEQSSVPAASPSGQSQQQQELDNAGSDNADAPGDTASTAETEPYEGGSSGDEAEGAGDQLRDTYYHEMEPVEPDEADGYNSAISDSGESDMDESVPELELAYLELPGDDKGAMADEETTSSHGSDDNADPRDTWTCPRPQCVHSNSAMRSKCERCWTTRPAWVHEPTRQRRRSSRRCRDQRRLRAQLSRSESAAGSGSGAGSAAGPDSQESVADADTSQDCVVCCDRRRDVVLVHVRRVVCLVACYECARRLWKAGDRCPSCRCRITQIMRVR